jgi:hypothetical protein
MPHRHALIRVGVAVALLVPTIACTADGYTGDPGPSFLAGTAGNGTGKAGSYGGAGTSGGSTTTGHAGVTGHAGTNGHAGATGAAGTGAAAQACTVGATGTFTMAWTLEDGTGTATTCATLAATTVDVDIANLDTGAQTHATVPCAAMGTTTCALPEAEAGYSVSMKLRTDGGTLLAEIAAPQLFILDGQATPIASVPFRVGGPEAAMSRGIALTWSIVNDDTGAALTCAQAMGAKVRLTVGTKTFDLACTDGKGRTTALAPGDYPVSLRLLDAAMGELSVTQTMTIHVGAGQLVFLGDVPFGVVVQ